MITVCPDCQEPLLGPVQTILHYDSANGHPSPCERLQRQRGLLPTEQREDHPS